MNPYKLSADVAQSPVSRWGGEFNVQTYDKMAATRCSEMPVQTFLFGHIQSRLVCKDQIRVILEESHIFKSCQRLDILNWHEEHRLTVNQTSSGASQSCAPLHICSCKPRKRTLDCTVSGLSLSDLKNWDTSATFPDAEMRKLKRHPATSIPPPANLASQRKKKRKKKYHTIIASSGPSKFSAFTCNSAATCCQWQYLPAGSPLTLLDKA